MIGNVFKSEARSPDTGLHMALRDGTRDWHHRVEDMFAVFDLGRHQGLRGFLLAQGRAVLPLERALDRLGAADILPDWSIRQRGRALRNDLSVFNVQLPPECDVPDLSSVERRIGALYVLEGSRLGGRILARRVRACGENAEAPTSFLLHSAGALAWASFLTALDRDDLDRTELLAGACAVFQMFGDAATLQAKADGLVREDSQTIGPTARLPDRADRGKQPATMASGEHGAPLRLERRATS